MVKDKTENKVKIGSKTKSKTVGSGKRNTQKEQRRKSEP